jgi:hypothetical protein
MLTKFFLQNPLLTFSIISFYFSLNTGLYGASSPLWITNLYVGTYINLIIHRTKIFSIVVHFQEISSPKTEEWDLKKKKLLALKTNHHLLKKKGGNFKISMTFQLQEMATSDIN